MEVPATWVIAAVVAGAGVFWLLQSGDASTTAPVAAASGAGPAKAKKKKKSKAEKAAAAAAAGTTASKPAAAAPESKKSKKKAKPAAPAPAKDAPAAQETEAPAKDTKISGKAAKRAKAAAAKASAAESKVEQQQPQPQKKRKNVLNIVAQEDADWGDDGGWNTVKSEHKSKPKAAAKKETGQQTIKVESKKEQDPSESIRVERQHHGLLIGPKFATLNSIQEATNTRITMPGRDSTSTEIHIAGNPEGIKKAKRCIQDMVEKGYSHALNPGLTDSHIFVPVEKRAIVSGKQGVHVKLLESTFNVKIRLPDRNSDVTRVYIVGEKNDVKQARTNIKHLLQYNYSPVTHPGWTKDDMDFPRHMVGFLIGPRGSKIKSLKADSKCEILVPDYINEQKLIIVGPRAGVDRAKMLINRILNPPEDKVQKKSQYYEEEEEEDEEDDSWARPPAEVTHLDW